MLAEAGSFGFQIHAFHLVPVERLQKPFARDLAADVVLIETFVQTGQVVYTAQSLLQFRIGMASLLLVVLKRRKGFCITYQQLCHTAKFQQ